MVFSCKIAKVCVIYSVAGFNLNSIFNQSLQLALLYLKPATPARIFIFTSMLNVLKTNNRYGRLVVQDKFETRANGKRYWLCRCDCGNEVWVRSHALSNTRTQTVIRSCGCLKRETTAQLNFKHGMSNTPEFIAWRNMLRRCYDPKDNSFLNYGAMGKKVCSAWQLSFKAFFASMGLRPSKKHSIDRIDNSLHYSCGQCKECKLNNWPMNCAWKTSKEQNNNRRDNRLLTLANKTLTLAQWEEATGIPQSVIRHRIDTYEWSTEEALQTPTHKLFELNGKLKTFNDWCRIYSISISTVKSRMLRYGWNFEKALTTPLRTNQYR